MDSYVYSHDILIVAICVEAREKGAMLKICKNEIFTLMCWYVILLTLRMYASFLDVAIPSTQMHFQCINDRFS